MDEHVNAFFKGSFTARASDWELRLCIEFDDILKARNAEAFIKRMNSRKFIEKLIQDAEWFRIKFNS
jgi:putative endonuclease